MSKAVQVPADDVQTLKLKIADMEARERVRAKYGSRLSESQIQSYIKEEAQAVATKARMVAAAEQTKRDQIAREKEIRKSAVELVSSGRIICAVGGVRREANGQDLSLPCPECGASLVGSHEAIFKFAEDWTFTTAGERFGMYSPMNVFSASNPLGNYRGAPFWVSHCKCSACKHSALIQMLLVVI
jgi:hypothetical protein